MADHSGVALRQREHVGRCGHRLGRLALGLGQGQETMLLDVHRVDPGQQGLQPKRPARVDDGSP